VNFIAPEAEIGGGGFNVAIPSVEIPHASMLGHLPPLLRRVVFVGKAAFRQFSTAARAACSANFLATVRVQTCSCPARLTGDAAGGASEFSRRFES
jgi:hypothetical protein